MIYFYTKIYLQLALIQRIMHHAKGWFNEGPALFKVQGDLKDLSSSVVSFGSQIQDLSSTVTTLKESNARIQDVQTTIQQNVTSIKVHNQTFLIKIFRKCIKIWSTCNLLLYQE